MLKRYYGVLIRISPGYPPVEGRLHTRYSPIRRSSAEASSPVTPRLACVRPAASVHPEPGSNSPLYKTLNFCDSIRLITLSPYFSIFQRTL